MAKAKAKPTKVTKDELKVIQDLVSGINQTQMDVGGLAFQQQLGIQKINTLQEQLKMTSTKLEEKYGKVSVNIADGSLKQIPDEPTN